MAKKGSKATKKFAKSGELKRAIDTRRKHQKLKKQIQARKSVRGAPVSRGAGDEVDEEPEENIAHTSKKSKGKARAKAVDFLDDDQESGEEGQDDAVTSKGK